MQIYIYFTANRLAFNRFDHFHMENGFCAKIFCIEIEIANTKSRYFQFYLFLSIRSLRFLIRFISVSICICACVCVRSCFATFIVCWCLRRGRCDTLIWFIMLLNVKSYAERWLRLLAGQLLWNSVQWKLKRNDLNSTVTVLCCRVDQVQRTQCSSQLD